MRAVRTTVEHFRRHPSKYTFRYPSCSITLSETSLAVGVLFKQLIPAVLMDLGLRLKGQRPKLEGIREPLSQFKACE